MGTPSTITLGDANNSILLTHSNGSSTTKAVHTVGGTIVQEAVLSIPTDALFDFKFHYKAGDYRIYLDNVLVWISDNASQVSDSDFQQVTTGYGDWNTGGFSGRIEKIITGGDELLDHTAASWEALVADFPEHFKVH